MKSVREIIFSRKFLGGVDISNLMLIDHLWKKEFSEFSSVCDIYAIEKDILILKVKNSVFMNEVRNRKDFLVREINKYFKNRFIRDIRIIS